MAGIEDYNKKSFFDNMKNYINGLEQKNNENALQKETVGREDYNDGNLDDYRKLLANSLSGGIYDLGRMFYEGNPLSYLPYVPDSMKDLPGLGEFAFGASPFEDGGGTFFDYDTGFKPFNQDPESVENVGRALSSFAVPIGGMITAPKKAKAVYDVMGKVFPSLKHWDDLGIMNQKIRSAINAEKGVKSKFPKITALWDKIRPLYQAPYRGVRHAINPLRWRKNYDAKLGEKILSYPNKIKAIKHMSKISKPERNYAATAARNWAIAGGVRSGIEGAKYVNENKKLPPFLSSANAAQPSYNNSPGHPGNRNYRSMQPKPNITIEFDNGYVDETGTIQPR